MTAPLVDDLPPLRRLPLLLLLQLLGSLLPQQQLQQTPQSVQQVRPLTVQQQQMLQMHIQSKTYYCIQFVKFFLHVMLIFYPV